MSDVSERLGACRGLLREADLDGVVVTDRADVRHLSAFRGEDATLVIAADAALICTDSRYWDQVAEEAGEFELARCEGSGLLADTARVAARALGADAALGFQGSSLSYADHRTLRRLHHGRLRDLGDRVGWLRVVKDAAETERMRRAAALTEEALEIVVGRGLVGRREADVAWELAAEYHRLGAEGEAFPAIVAAGAHGAQAHAVPSARVIASGDLVVIDTGARCDGYCADITRTFAAGEPGAELRRLYDVVLEAQLAGLAAVRAGAHGHGDVDAACRAVIAAAGHGDDFGHGTGHGVGLEIHEAPTLGRTRGDVLRAGMVCTVEPGIYLPGVAGVRIEDTVLVTADGCERLTRSRKELRVTA